MSTNTQAVATSVRGGDGLFAYADVATKTPGTAVAVRPITFVDVSTEPVGLGVTSGDVGRRLRLADAETQFIPVITGAVAVAVTNDDASAPRDGVRARLRRVARLARLLVKAATRTARGSLSRVREACTWLTEGAVKSLRRRAYTGQHRVQRTPLGRERSDAEFTRAAQARAREPRGEEGELVFQDGDTFVSWLALAMESARELHVAQHHDANHRFVCT